MISVSWYWLALGLALIFGLGMLVGLAIYAWDGVWEIIAGRMTE